MSLLTVFKIARQKQVLASCGNPVKSYKLDHYVDLLKSNTPFSFSRFGDGEWSAIFGAPGANCDGHEYFPQLSQDLCDTIKKPLPYVYAMQPRALKTEGKKIEAFLKENDIHIQWHDSDVFHIANGEGRLYPLIKQLRKMKVVLIGPSNLRVLQENVFEYAQFVEIPKQNCYLSKTEIRNAILKVSKITGSAVFAFSASMTANVLIHELYEELGSSSWLIDFGSLWDVYAGELSRTYFAQGNWEKKIKKNLGF